jgi:chromosome partitioning protein
MEGFFLLVWKSNGKVQCMCTNGAGSWNAHSVMLGCRKEQVNYLGRVIAITNQKGGVAKTTTAVNLGAALALDGKRVLLVDIDPQGNASSGVGFDRNKIEECIYDVLIGKRDLPAVLRPCECVPGMNVIPATLRLAGAEIEMVGIPGRESILKRALAPVRDKYDYVLMDCPPSLGLLTVNALTAADSVIVPLQCEYYALEGLGHLMNAIQLVQRQLNPGLEIEGVLLTMFDGRTNLSIQVVDEVKRHFKKLVYGTVIPRNVRLGEAPSYGKPVVVYDPRCRGAEVYRELAKEVAANE